jgi:hypothetical protein
MGISSRGKVSIKRSRAREEAKSFVVFSLARFEAYHGDLQIFITKINNLFGGKESPAGQQTEGDNIVTSMPALRGNGRWSKSSV